MTLPILRNGLRGVVVLSVCVLLFVPLPSRADELNGVGKVSSLEIEGNNLRETICRLLESPEEKDHAWGAYWAGKYGLSEFIPELRLLLQSPLKEGPAKACYLSQTALDALIRLQAEVPGEELLPLYQQYPSEVLILLANAPDRNQSALLTLLKDTRGGNGWVAICNLLAATKAPKFAAILLREFQIKVFVSVSDNGGIGAGMGGGGAWGSVGDGVGAVLTGCPPTTLYFLARQPQRGAVVVAPGPTTIYYHTLVIHPQVQKGFGRADEGGDENQMRVAYLAEMLGTRKEELDFRLDRFYSIAWEGPEQFTREIGRIRTEIERSYCELADKLRSAHLLTDAEAAALTPHYEVSIQDLRIDKQPPIPVGPGETLVTEPK